jgi:hypothetical protein
MEQKVEAPKMQEAPTVARVGPALPIGGGGGTNWTGRKCAEGRETDPMGAFAAGGLGRVRSCFGDWAGPAQVAEVALSVTRDGSVASYKLVHGTGVSSDDEHLLDAVRCVQKKGVSAPPDGVGRVVTLRLRPSRGFASGQG